MFSGDFKFFLAKSVRETPCNKVAALDKTHKQLGNTLFDMVRSSQMGSYLDYMITDKNVTKIKRKRSRKRVKRDSYLGESFKRILNLQLTLS